MSTPSVIPAATVSARLEPFAREIARTYANHNWSTDQLYSIVADAIRLIEREAHLYSDPSCVELSKDELEAEGRKKLVEIFHGKGGNGTSTALSLKNRSEIFAWIKSCVKNHMRGIVNRHRNTAKRTGVRPPSKANRPEIGDQFRHPSRGVGVVVRLCGSSGETATRFGQPYIEIDPEWGVTDKVMGLFEDAGYLAEGCGAEVSLQDSGKIRVTGIDAAVVRDLLRGCGDTAVSYHNDFVHTVRLQLGSKVEEIPLTEFAEEWSPVMDVLNGQPKPEVSFDAAPEVRSVLEFMTAQTFRADDHQDNDFTDTLSPLECLVFQELTNPSRAAFILAAQDAQRGRQPGKSIVDVSVQPRHHAKALGLGIIEFEATVAAIQRKFLVYSGRSTPVVPSCDQMPPQGQVFFTPAELLVYRQLTSPNQFSTLLAKARRDSMRVEYLAAGIGLEQSTFIFLVGNVKLKVKQYMEQSLQPHNAAVTALEKIFEVQVPRSLDSLVVRRLFTIAARSNFEKVDENVANLLKTIGSEVPTLDSQGNLTCFGVLYADHGEASEKTCAACAARIPCEARVKNAGLDSITISPSLFSARAKARTVVVPEMPVELPKKLVEKAEKTDKVEKVAEPVSAPVARVAPTPTSERRPTSEREEAIRAHLQANYKEVFVHGAGGYFKHKTARKDGRVKHIVWIGQSKKPVPEGVNPSFLIRVCGERPATRKSLGLVQVGQCWYIPDSMPVKRVIEAIDGHANYLFTVKLED